MQCSTSIETGYFASLLSITWLGTQYSSQQQRAEGDEEEEEKR